MKPVTPARGGRAHEVRIIGGLWKRTRLQVPDLPGLRPTPDRVRETLYNWLGQDLHGWHCLDVFAGTGALGLEAASRGAASVLLVEHDATLVRRLQAVLQPLRNSPDRATAHQAAAVRVQRGDGVQALQQAPAEGLDLILLDPPFEADLFLPALRVCMRALKPQGLVYLEAPRAWTDAELAPLGLHLQRHLRAGAVHAHLLRRLPPDAATA